MTHRPPGDDWWQAPDGTWYPPESHPARPGGDGPKSDEGEARHPVLATTRWLGAAFLTAAALAPVAAVALWAESTAFDPSRIRTAAGVGEALGAAGLMLTAWSVAAAASGVLMVVWLFRAIRATEPFGASGTTWSPGWAVGAWFIPGANLIIPKLVVNQIDRVTHPDSGTPPVGDRWRRASLLPSGHWWWGAFVVSSLCLALGLTMVLEQLEAPVPMEAPYRDGLRLAAAGLALHGGSSLAGAGMARTIAGRFSS